MIAYYDLSRCPPTYDTVSFLLHVEHERIKRGVEDIVIEVLPGPVGGFRRDTVWPRQVDERIKLRDGVMFPMMAMLPSARRITIHPVRPPKQENSIGYGQYAMQFARFVSAYAAGIRPLRPVWRVTPGPYLVTITLREAEHWKARNSKVQEWIKAAHVIASRGYQVVFVRDTLRAYEGLDGFATAPAASVDLHERAALYRSAFCNLGVNNGPMWFAMALDAPVLMVRPATENIGSGYGRAWFERCGIGAGQQMRGAPSYQRLVWKDDTAPNIIEAFGQFCLNSRPEPAREMAKELECL